MIHFLCTTVQKWFWMVWNVVRKTYVHHEISNLLVLLPTCLWLCGLELVNSDVVHFFSCSGPPPSPLSLSIVLQTPGPDSLPVCLSLEPCLLLQLEGISNRGSETLAWLISSQMSAVYVVQKRGTFDFLSLKKKKKQEKIPQTTPYQLSNTPTHNLPLTITNTPTRWLVGVKPAWKTVFLTWWEDRVRHCRKLCISMSAKLLEV